MSKQLPTGNLTITFTHSLPLPHVLAYLRTAAFLRRSARESLEMAARYQDGVQMRTWLETISKKEIGRADAVEHLVQIMARQPSAKPFVVDYMSSVLYPGRSKEDLEAFTEEVKREGMERVEEMAKWGFRRHDVSSSRTSIDRPTPTVVFMDPENADQDSDDVVRERIKKRLSNTLDRMNANHKYAMCCAGALGDESKDSH